MILRTMWCSFGGQLKMATLFYHRRTLQKPWHCNLCRLMPIQLWRLIQLDLILFAQFLFLGVWGVVYIYIGCVCSVCGSGAVESSGSCRRAGIEAFGPKMTRQGAKNLGQTPRDGGIRECTLRYVRLRLPIPGLYGQPDSWCSSCLHMPLSWSDFEVLISLYAQLLVVSAHHCLPYATFWPIFLFIEKT